MAYTRIRVSVRREPARCAPEKFNINKLHLLDKYFFSVIAAEYGAADNCVYWSAIWWEEANYIIAQANGRPFFFF